MQRLGGNSHQVWNAAKATRKRKSEEFKKPSCLDFLIKTVNERTLSQIYGVIAQFSRVVRPSVGPCSGGGNPVNVAGPNLYQINFVVVVRRGGTGFGITDRQ